MDSLLLIGRPAFWLQEVNGLCTNIRMIAGSDCWWQQPYRLLLCVTVIFGRVQGLTKDSSKNQAVCHRVFISLGDFLKSGQCLFLQLLLVYVCMVTYKTRFQEFAWRGVTQRYRWQTNHQLTFPWCVQAATSDQVLDHLNGWIRPHRSQSVQEESAVHNRRLPDDSQHYDILLMFTACAAERPRLVTCIACVDCSAWWATSCHIYASLQWACQRVWPSQQGPQQLAWRWWLRQPYIHHSPRAAPGLEIQTSSFWAVVLTQEYDMLSW